MKFLANENFPKSSYLLLKNENLDIVHIGLTHSSISDHEVMVLAISENRIILTFDSDYGELVFKMGYKPEGVVFMRIKEFAPHYPAELILDLLNNREIPLIGKFTVIDEEQIRQRNIN